MDEPTSDRSDVGGLRREEVEFYEALTALIAEMPRGTTVNEALGSPEGARLRRKYALRYGRQPPL